MEEKLGTVWQEVLGVEKSRNTATTSSMLGGDSIKAIQVSARLMKLGLEDGDEGSIQEPLYRGIKPSCEV